jgi:chromosomal replication initiation ATPase DnaA
MSRRQLAFNLPVRTALGREDFLVSGSNAMAVRMLDGWRNWPQRKLLLIGPPGAGKTHLATIWAGEAGAAVVPAGSLADADISALRQTVVVEDITVVVGHAPSEQALFHLHNLVQAEGGTLLLTSDAAPSVRPFALPDLQSRIAATQPVRIDPPDDHLLAAVLAKHFADRQLAVSPALVPWLAQRIERSLDAARAAVAALDAAALSRGTAITRTLAAEVLDMDGGPET